MELRLVGELPQRFARVALSNGRVPTGEYPRVTSHGVPPSWRGATSASVSRQCQLGDSSPTDARALRDEFVAAYDAPFVDETVMEGAREFSRLVPSSRDDPAHDANGAAWREVRAFDTPFLRCFCDGDVIGRDGEAVLVRDGSGARSVPRHHRGRGTFRARRAGPE